MENENVFIYHLNLQIFKFVKTLLDTFPSREVVVANNKWFSWHAVVGTTMVLNVDGSSQGNSKPYGFKGVVRHPSCSCLTNFAGSIGVSTILHVELLALYHCLTIAWDKVIKDLICYSYYTLAIYLVKT